MSQSPSARSRSPGPGRYSPRRSYSRSVSPSDRRGRSYTPDGKGSETISTIYVGGISFDTDERSLQQYFEKFGVVLETKVVIDRDTNRSKGYGFVKFEDARDAKDAIGTCNGKLLDGRTIRCNMAKYNPGGGGRTAAWTPNDGPRGPADYGSGRGYGGRGDYGGRGYGGRGYDDGYHGGGRGRGGRFDNGGRGNGGRFGYGGRGGPPPGAHPAERAPNGEYHQRSFSPSARGPPSKRRRSGSASPGPGAQREGRTKQRRSRRHYSTSRSGSSASRTPSRSVSRSPRARRAPAASGAGDEELRAALAAAQRRNEELDKRVAALEVQAKAAATARGALTDQLADMTNAQQKAEATHKLYRRWMSALLDRTQAMLEGKEEVAQAEAELADRTRVLGQLLVEADAFLSQERRSSRAARRAEQSAEPSASARSGHDAAPPADQPSANGVPPLPAAEEQEGWQVADAPAAADPPATEPGSAGPLAGTRFTINA